MKKFWLTLQIWGLGLLGWLLQILGFVAIVAVFEVILYLMAAGVILILLASFWTGELPSPEVAKMTTAMVFYSTMAVSAVLAALSVIYNARREKARALLRNEPQPGPTDQKSAEQG